MSTKLHIGKSGEYQIVSTLALRGYDIAMPMVDLGKDIVSIDPNNMFSIQVKSSANKTNSKKLVTFDVPIQTKFCESNEKTVDFIIIPLYMPLEYGNLSPSSRWWNIIFPWGDLFSLCTGDSPIGVPYKKSYSRTIYIKYTKNDKKLLVTKPQKGVKKNPAVEITEYCDGLNRSIWDKHFPTII